MPMAHYDPWRVLNQLHGELDRLFETRDPGDGRDTMAACDWTPAVDIRETPQGYVIQADVPGVDPAEIDVRMEDGVLTIKGTRAPVPAAERDGYKRTERVRGAFFRRFSLPDTADAERISANCRNGVLEVVIPKHERIQPRRIQVEG